VSEVSFSRFFDWIGFLANQLTIQGSLNQFGAFLLDGINKK
jgi:hypothetical protein